MFGYWKWLHRDLTLRLMGMALAVFAALALTGLYRSFHAYSHHDPSAEDLGLAAFGFLGLSAGTGLTFLGRHIHDRIEISERWERRTLVPGEPQAARDTIGCDRG